MDKNLKGLLILLGMVIPIMVRVVPTDPVLRKPSYPFISGDTFRKFCDHVFDETNVVFNPKVVKQGDTVFINNDLLEQFFNQAHPNILSKYIIVSHNSDRWVPGKFSSYLDDEKIIAWFSQNIDIPNHPKLHPLPIGLANYHWPHGKTEIVKNAMKNIPALEERSGYFAYLNFDVGTNRRGRAHVWNYFKNTSFCNVAQKKRYPVYLEDMKKCKFVISPPGNGVDCHRNWEALLMGCIPIVKHSTIDKLFGDLPVILIDDWREVTKEFLKEKYQEMKDKKYNYDKLYADYWLNQIRNIQLSFKNLSKNS